MKTAMTFLVLLFVPLLTHSKPKRETLYIPLSHNGATLYDNKVVAPPLSTPHSNRGLAFMAQFHFGSPQKRQLLLLDTGSSLTWTQCFPCDNCFEQKVYTKYRPRDSMTYRDAICETDTEKDINPSFTYHPHARKCTYQQHYLDGSNIKGTLALEMITVDTLDGGFKRVHGVYFGCNQFSDRAEVTGTGILGLGVGRYSIIGEFGSKFSFCLGRISEPKASHNLILGDGANLEGQATVLNITGGHYMFKLTAIIVGEDIELSEPVDVFVDTGSAISHVSSSIYYDFADKFDELIGIAPITYEPRLCYQENAVAKLTKMDVGFQFSGGAELTIDIQEVFLPQGRGVRCLAVANNKEAFSEIVIGVIAMQGYNLGYDLKAKTGYIQQQDCEIEE